MTELTDLNYWLAVLASLTLWGTIGAAALAVRSEISQRRSEHGSRR